MSIFKKDNSQAEEAFEKGRIQGRKEALKELFAKMDSELQKPGQHPLDPANKYHWYVTSPEGSAPTSIWATDATVMPTTGPAVRYYGPVTGIVAPPKDGLDS